MLIHYHDEIFKESSKLIFLCFIGKHHKYENKCIAYQNILVSITHCLHGSVSELHNSLKLSTEKIFMHTTSFIKHASVKRLQNRSLCYIYLLNKTMRVVWQIWILLVISFLPFYNTNNVFAYLFTKNQLQTLNATSTIKVRSKAFVYRRKHQILNLQWQLSLSM